MSNILLYPGSGGLEYFSLSRLIPIEQVLDEGYLVVRKIDKTNVASLVACELKGVPPIEIVQTNRGPVVIDGYHRWEAARQLGHDEIIGKAGTYPSERAVIDAAFCANLTHGKQASSQMRTAYAFWLWMNDKDINESEAARKAGITASVLNRYIARKKAQTEGKAPQQKRPPDDVETLIAVWNRFFEHENRDLDAMSRSLAARISNSPANVKMLMATAGVFREAASLVQAKK